MSILLAYVGQDGGLPTPRCGSHAMALALLVAFLGVSALLGSLSQPLKKSSLSTKAAPGVMTQESLETVRRGVYWSRSGGRVPRVS